MARYRTELPFAGPAEVAFDYLADFSTVSEWDPGITEAARLDEGPVALGSRFHVIAKTGPRETPFEYRITELEPGRRVRLVGDSSSIHSEDEIAVAPVPGDPGRSVVTYDAELSLKGVAVVLSPLLALGFRRVGDRAAAGLRAKLDELATPSPAG